MAKTKKTKKTANRNTKTVVSTAKSPSVVKEKSISKDISEQLRLGESYISLILGAIVVLGLSVVFFLFVKESGFQNTITPPKIDESVIPTTMTQSVSEKTYVLQDGEGLWDVAVKFYGDGYRYTEIIEANKLENPDAVEPGTKLIIPNAK